MSTVDRRNTWTKFAAALLVLAATGVAAQSWTGDARMHGTVYDKDDQPLAGAEVRLSPWQNPAEGPAPVVTDSRGSWSVDGLGGGLWRIVVAATGYIQADGRVQLAAGAGEDVPITLRPLSEVLPAFAENPSTVYKWLDKGNSLLAQGHTTEARSEYLKALRELADDQKPEVLRAVARTYFLEERADDAVDALKLSLVVQPGDKESRQLFEALLEGLGRGEEARGWLARLDTEGPEALAADIEPGEEPERPTHPDREIGPTLEPEAGRTGSYRTSFTVRSPLSSLDVYLERRPGGREEILQADPDAAAYDIGQEVFEVFVPEGYDPSVPHGLFVWISPTASGRPWKDSQPVFAERRMIWVGADNSGNGRGTWDRMGLALDAAEAMKKLYTIDERRIYVGGYSGGGRMSTALAVLYPEVFQGGVFFMGSDYWKKERLPDKPGAYWPPAFPPPPPDKFRLVKERNRYVFVTGELDFNRPQIRVYFRRYNEEGFRHVTYVEIPGASHYSGFGGEWFARFLDALDGGLEP